MYLDLLAFFLNYNVIQCENFPFVVRIVTGIPSAASHENMCSGSLFLQNWVLTSGFCIHGILVSLNVDFRSNYNNEYTTFCIFCFSQIKLKYLLATVLQSYFEKLKQSLYTISTINQRMNIT